MMTISSLCLCASVVNAFNHSGTEKSQQAVDKWLKRVSNFEEEMIVQELVAIQERCGYLPQEELRVLARRKSVPLHRIHEVASFYPLFKLQPPPVVEVKVCRDMACHLRGSTRLKRGLEALASEIDPKQVLVEGVSCLGRCDFAPSAVSINDNVYWGLPEEEIRKNVRLAAAREHLPHQHGDRSPPGWKIDVYEGKPRYDAVRRFIDTRDGDSMLKSIETANLRGMGGAGFPTARKWSAVRAAAGDVKYVVCNADECEPGTFKDRELLGALPTWSSRGLSWPGSSPGPGRARCTSATNITTNLMLFVMP